MQFAFDSVGCEGCNAAGVAKLSDGDERGISKGREDVGKASGWR